MSDYDNFEQSVDSQESKPTILSEGIEFIGIIKGQSNLVLSGKISGTVEVPRILIESTGQVEAELFTEDARIKGVLKGQLDTETLSVGPDASINGSVAYSTIETHKGATLLGMFRKKPLTSSDGQSE